MLSLSDSQISVRDGMVDMLVLSTNARKGVQVRVLPYVLVPIAQSVERRAYNAEAMGSNPIGNTKDPVWIYTAIYGKKDTACVYTAINI